MASCNSTGSSLTHEKMSIMWTYYYDQGDFFRRANLTNRNNVTRSNKRKKRKSFVYAIMDVNDRQ